MSFVWTRIHHSFNASLNPNFARFRDARILQLQGEKKTARTSCVLRKKHSLSQKVNDAWREAVSFFPFRVNTATMAVFVSHEMFCKQECKANLEEVYQWPSWTLCFVFLTFSAASSFINIQFCDVKCLRFDTRFKVLANWRGRYFLEKARNLWTVKQTLNCQSLNNTKLRSSHTVLRSVHLHSENDNKNWFFCYPSRIFHSEQATHKHFAIKNAQRGIAQQTSRSEFDLIYSP